MIFFFFFFSETLGTLLSGITISCYGDSSNSIYRQQETDSLQSEKEEILLQKILINQIIKKKNTPRHLHASTNKHMKSFF